MADTAGRRILVTGIASDLATRLAARLEADERVEYIAGVDVHEPRSPLERTELIRGDLRNPLVASVVESSRVDTIVHLWISAMPGRAGGRSRMKEQNVIGTMQLLAAAQKSPRLRKLVLKSTTAVYGSHYSDPALFREDIAPDSAHSSGYAKDAVEVEGHARAFGHRRPDVALSILRFANFIGPGVDSPLTRYFALPVAPTVLGYDPRLQLVHIEDAAAVLERTTLEDLPGICNVAGPGILYLSQAVRLAGKPWAAVPEPFVHGIADVARRMWGVDFSPEQLRFLFYGRVGDITRLRRRLGYEPRYSTGEAFREFLTHHIRPVVDRETAERWETDLGVALTRAYRTAAALCARPWTAGSSP
ncbi:MAG: NAD-dependent epimerase/dehydratase family protein [Nitriliruptorales bacterium]|nr:NAD-dependent epimerase/dehydratase family protein [Nitriliruptorales bacterium]